MREEGHHHDRTVLKVAVFGNCVMTSSIGTGLTSRFGQGLNQTLRI
jgi:hypothetical protein